MRGEEEAPSVCRHPSACHTGPCRRGARAWRPTKPPEGGGEGGGSFNQEEVKQPHRRYTQIPNIINYLVPPEAPGHLPLATLPCLS